MARKNGAQDEVGEVVISANADDFAAQVLDRIDLRPSHQDMQRPAHDDITVLTGNPEIALRMAATDAVA